MNLPSFLYFEQSEKQMERKMWTQPWRFAEGFLIGCGLVVAGLLLQLSSGPIDWDLFAFPANVIALAVFLLLIVIAFALRKKVYAFRFLGSFHAAIPALACAAVLTILMGLTRQASPAAPTNQHDFISIIGLNKMLSNWSFVLVYVYIAFILGMIILKRVARMFHTERRCLWRDIPFLLNHLGLFIVMTCATLGNADMQRLKMITAVGEPEWRALAPGNVIKEMPLAIELKRFIMETYDDGSPKRYASEIQILTKTGKNIETIVDVNKPYELDGWKIYQYGYDTNMGANSRISILELVSDPWLPLVYTGIFMMLAGAVCMFVMGGRKTRRDDEVEKRNSVTMR